VAQRIDFAHCAHCTADSLTGAHSDSASQNNPKSDTTIIHPHNNMRLLLLTLLSMMARMSQGLSSTAKPAYSVSTSTSSASAGGKNLFIQWFRLMDLRVHDNPSLCKTVELAKKDDKAGILPVFCFDPRTFGDDARSSFGNLKCGPKRAKFILESVVDLRKQLESRGSGLIVAHGTPEDVLLNIMSKVDDKRKIIPRVFCQEEVCSEELSVDKALRAALTKHNPKASLQTIWGSTLYNLEDLPFKDGPLGIPDTFTPFRNKVEKTCAIGVPLPVPNKGDLALTKVDIDGMAKCSLTYLPSLEELGYTSEDIEFANTIDKRSVLDFKGGESVALARVQDYIWDRDLLKIYFDTRNGMIGGDYSTKFSPWLAHGCLSPRHVARECQKYERERVENKSTYWVVFELLWRDYFKVFALKHGNKIFSVGGTIDSDKRWGYDRRHVAAWKEGRTGFPLVDANMRELAATGFMSNRGRQNVCSFLAHDMNTDWRHGADYFETVLLDYDVHSNWGNWCSGAAMTGGRLNKFNIVKQSKDYDQHGEYLRLWLPELKNVPTEFVHAPWKMTQFHQIECGVRLGVDYPNPIVSPDGFVPKGDGGGRGRGGNNRDGNNRNRGRGQREDMKSLKPGQIRMK
jgi:deoxyribodipyrimidine photo-lyase